MNSKVKLSLILGLISLILFCSGNDGKSIKKKSMSDLHYVYFLPPTATTNIDSSITRALILFASDPADFGDPVGIIDSFPDPELGGTFKRRIGLISLDDTRETPDSVAVETIEGGRTISMTVQGSESAIDSCWREILDFANQENLKVVLPGIEVYRGYGSESNESSTEIIIRIK